ncbi:hypothetical protein LF41_329 [Lysobacter dokdonensis DS-58]|uniref:Uncharacterized protein n=1 Tax=Lysobacter dokdonensis DS-58 TaxID=1300345 RepID=A0A0A2WF19_9GAMM|nr:hypothetical protein LF41_329 [Lysobacter dokdonensis DS-58]
MPCDLPLELALSRGTVDRDPAVFEAAGRRRVELVGPSVERVQARERCLQGVAAVAAQVFPPEASGRVREGPCRLDSPVRVREVQRVVGVIALQGVFRRDRRAVRLRWARRRKPQAGRDRRGGADILVLVQQRERLPLRRRVARPLQRERVRRQVAFARQRIARAITRDAMDAIEPGIPHVETIAHVPLRGQRIEGLLVLSPTAVAHPALVAEHDALAPQRGLHAGALPRHPRLVQLRAGGIDDRRQRAMGVGAIVVRAGRGDAFSLDESRPFVGQRETRAEAQSRCRGIGVLTKGVVVDLFVAQAQVPLRRHLREGEGGNAGEQGAATAEQGHGDLLDRMTPASPLAAAAALIQVKRGPIRTSPKPLALDPGQGRAAVPGRDWARNDHPSTRMHHMTGGTP